MSRALFLAVAVLSCSLGACLDPIVGATCADGFAACDGQCVDLSADPDHCGACGSFCPGECLAGTCSEPTVVLGGDADIGDTDGGGGGTDGGGTDGGGTDGGGGGTDGGAPVCDVGTTMCDDVCVDLMRDPDHCGSCGHDCASGLCEDGVCVGEPPGHVVLIGHDYTEARRGMERLLGNAVFLAPGGEPRVAAYRGDASALSIAGVDGAVDAVAADLGRSVRRYQFSAADVASELTSMDVLLIYPQQGGTDAELTSTGAAWAPTLREFLDRGGVIVCLDGPAGHSGTYQLLTSAGVISVASRATVTDHVVTIVAPNDAVATQVPLVYAVTDYTVGFDTDETIVVAEAGGHPVVIRRVW